MNINALREFLLKNKLFHFIRFGMLITLIILVLVSAIMAHHITVNEFEMEFESLPASFDGYKVAVIADLHIGLYTKEKQIYRIYEILDEQNPDIVVIVGDHIYTAPSIFKRYSEKNGEAIRSIFSKISSKYPTYAVNGNHDNVENKEEIIKITIESGIVHLDNKYAWITNANNTNERIILNGIADLDTDHIDFEAALTDSTTNDFNIMLSHNPKAVTILTNSWHDGYVDLMLAGHTHGGQINLGSSMDYSFAPAHKYGLKQYGHTQLYVTSGIGMSFLPLRFNAPAEVAFITLKSTQTATKEEDMEPLNSDISVNTEIIEDNKEQ